MPKLKAGEKYLSGQIDFGIFGKAKIYAFRVEKKEEASRKQPDFRIYVKDPSTGRLRRAGALWIQQKKEEENIVEREERVL